MLMKILKKAFVCGLILATFVSFSATSVFASDSSNYIIEDQTVYFDNLDDMGKFVTENNLQPKVDFSEYFYIDDTGNIQMRINPTELKEKYNLTDKDISDLKVLNTQVKYTDDSMLRGFVGLHIKLGPKVRGMSAVVAGGFATGYAGFYLSKFAANPLTAGAVGAISASIGGTVGWAVNKGLKEVDVGTDVPFVSLAYTVNVP